MKHETRENWLTEATDMLRISVFKDAGAEIPTVRLSVGFPSHRENGTTLGTYWRAESTEDGTPQIFISPILSDPIRILSTLTHELVHACTPGDGHGSRFRRLAKAVGLTGPMTKTQAGEKLIAILEDIANELGTIPHAAIRPDAKKRQRARMLKVTCEACGYLARITRVWLESKGPPICPCNHEVMNGPGPQ